MAGVEEGVSKQHSTGGAGPPNTMCIEQGVFKEGRDGFADRKLTNGWYCIGFSTGA